MSRIISGALTAINKGATDWSYHGLLAYGCQNVIVVLHPSSVKIVQTLAGHRSTVTKVKWCPENYPHGSRVPPHMRLASADEKGHIIVWDLHTATQHCSFNELNNKATDIHWLQWQDTSKDFLLALHPPYNLILWNADTGEKIWKKSYTETLLCFTLDPFCSSNVAFLTQAGNLMLVNDFCVGKVPSSNGQVFKISTLSVVEEPIDRSVKGGSQALISQSAKLMIKPMQMLRVPKKIGEDLIGQATSSIEEACPVLQLVYHPALRNLLIMVYSREVLFLDTETLQTTAHVLLEKNMASFSQVHPCSRRDAVYFVQENGCVTLRLQKCRSSQGDKNKKSETFGDYVLDIYNPLEVYYEGVCMSESLRITKAYRVLASALCPTTESTFAIIMITGKVLFYKLTSVEKQTISSWTLSDLVELKADLSIQPISKLKFVLDGLWTSLGYQPKVIRARPPLTDTEDILTIEGHENDSFYDRSLVAVGTSDGYIQLIDTEKGEIIKDFSVHSCPIRCMEWGGPYHVISAGYSQTLSTSSVVRNDLFSTNVRTGLIRVIRPECDESPVEMLRVSHYHCYLAVAFRDNPMEIWDLKHFRMLRRMSRSCPVIIDMAWSAKHHHARTMSKSAPSGDEIRSALLHSTETKARQTIYRENLVVLDNENHLYHVVVKGMHVRDGKEVNTQWATTSQVNAMVWKDDYLAFGDNEGKISIWDLGIKQSRASQIQRGSVKRLQFSPLPGDHTLAVLHSDGIAVWNVAKFTVIHHVMFPRDIPTRVVDLDLCGMNGHPVIITVDGCVRIAIDDVTFNQCLPSHQVDTSIFCPQLMLSSVGVAVMKLLLCDRNVLSEIKEKSKLNELLRSLPDGKIDKEVFLKQFDSLENSFCEQLNTCQTLAHRAKLVALLMGDHWDVKFWSVVSVSIYGENKEVTPTLEPALDYLWPRAFFRKLHMRRCCWFDSRRASYEQIQSQIESLIHLGQLDSAVHLLLNTETTHQEYYTDCLKACLLSAVHSSSACQSTIKLVATNLIASGKIAEGVQLLCLIGKSVDACRYLQSYSEWNKSVFLAKTTLDESECSNVMKKWAENLVGPQNGQKSWGLLILISLQLWEKALELLISMRQVNTAALVLECLSNSNQSIFSTLPPSLTEGIYSEYARELNFLGLTKSALFYCQKAGSLGENLKTEIEILTSDS